MHVLYLPNFTPTSLNKSVGRHWSVKAKQKKADRDLVIHYASQQGVIVAAGKRRVHIRVVLQKGQRAWDRDNLRKSLHDALTHAGLLIDDSPKWCEEGAIEYLRHSGELREVFILLEDLP